MQQNNSKIWGTAVVVTRGASHRLRSHSRPHQYALILSLSALAAGCGGAGSSAGRDSAQVTPTQPTSSTPTLDYPGPALFTVGTSANYGLIAIAFTPDGRAHARVQDLSTNETIDSDGQDGLSGAADGSFSVTFPAPSDVSLNGNFTGPDVISGTVMEGTVAKPFVAMRLGGSSTADYRYTGGFGNDNGYRVDFGTVDVTGSKLSGTGYQMNYVDAQSVLTNRELSFGTTLSDGMFVVTVDGSTSTSEYTAGQPTLNLGDPYDALLFLESTGCVLN
jgi:hypothetical protein